MLMSKKEKMKYFFDKWRQILGEMEDESRFMTKVSYVDNSVEIGDFFSKCTKKHEKSNKFPVGIILQVKLEKPKKVLN